MSDLKRVVATADWLKEHAPHGAPTMRPWAGPHAWRVRVCPCGAQHTEAVPYEPEDPLVGTCQTCVNEMHTDKLQACVACGDLVCGNCALGFDGCPDVICPRHRDD